MSKNKDAVEIHGCIVCARLFNVLAVYTSDGKLVECAVTSPGGHCLPNEGQVLIASKTGSQLGPYASGAGKVIWVVGAQKIVKDLDEGLKRIAEYCVPREEENMQERYNSGTFPSKILIVQREIRPGRVTVILVKEALGF